MKNERGAKPVSGLLSFGYPIETRKLAVWRRSSHLLAISFLAASSAWAASPAYTYQVIASSGDVIGGITLTNLYTVSISDDETVLVIGDTPNTASGALFSVNLASGSKSVVVQQGQSIGGYVLSQIGAVVRNDPGKVVFSSTIANGMGGTGIFTLKGPVVVPGQTISGMQISPQSFALNNAGSIVFSAVPNPPLSTAIATPTSVLYAAGSKVGGYTLTTATAPALSSDGKLAFEAGFSTGTQTNSGIFTQNGLVIEDGDVVSGNTVINLGAPTISKFGVIGYEIQYQSDPAIFEYDRAFYVDRSMIAGTGHVIDGQTLQQPSDPVAPLEDAFTLNAGGEALFFSNASNSNGSQTGGVFTAKHSVVAVGDTVAGLYIDAVTGASINDRGQIGLVVQSGTHMNVIVATPVNGAPLPGSTTYKLQDRQGKIIDLGWALNPSWGVGSYAFLFSFDESPDQQIIYTSDGKLRLAQTPDAYLYNDGGYLALGSSGDTFTIDQAGGAFTIKDGSLYLQSPGKLSPPNKLPFSSSPAYWGFINASPTGTTP